MVYLWLLVVLPAACAAVLFVLERRDERSLRDYLSQRDHTKSLGGPWEIHDSDDPLDDTAPAVLEPPELHDKRQSSWRR